MNGNIRRGRKAHFSYIEALYVAKEWVTQSEKCTNQEATLFLEGVCEISAKNWGVKRFVKYNCSF